MVTWHLVLLAALFLQLHPESPVLDKDVLDRHGERGADPAEAVDHQRDQRPVDQPYQCADVVAVEQLPGLGRVEHRRLTFPNTVRRPAHRGSRVKRHDLAHDQPVEQVADGGELLLHRRRGTLTSLALDPRSHMQRLDCSD